MGLETQTEVESIASVTDAAGDVRSPADSESRSAFDTGLDVSSTGSLLELDTQGKTTLDIGLTATASVSVVLEASPNGSDWFGPFKSWTGVTAINSGLFVGARYVRLRLTSAGSAGDTADAFLEVS